jgi:hypothetical protein
MKLRLTQRAQTALAAAGYSPAENPAIIALTAFAAQNSGLNWRNYYSTWADTNGRRAYASDARQISKAWRAFKAALVIARCEGVVDADVINEAPRAFSGRLQWENGHWDYCTGQYFNTEYRTAARVLLEQAIRAVRRRRPPQTAEITSIADLKRLNALNGGCWFEPAEMRFFGTRIETGIIHQKYFITSEQPPHGARQYSVRTFDAAGAIDTVGEFCSYATKTAARAAVPQS